MLAVCRRLGCHENRLQVGALKSWGFGKTVIERGLRVTRPKVWGVEECVVRRESLVLAAFRFARKRLRLCGSSSEYSVDEVTANQHPS